MQNLLKIFLVENNRLDYYTFVHAMSKIDYAVMHGKVKNGKEALDKLKKYDVMPDVIFSDIDMPDANGIAYIQRIARNPKTKNIPLVILSSDIAKAGYTKKLGAKAFIKKPDSCVKLLEKLELLFQLDFTDALNTTPRSGNFKFA